MLQHFPDHFQKQSFLRIDQLRLRGRLVVKCRVKSIDILYETAPLAIDPVVLRVRVEVFTVVETAGRYFGDAITPLPQHVPQLFEVARSGKSSGSADDCDVVTLL